jgi:hypothetical protein
MAVATALADRRIVSNILRELSDMKYKDRRQRSPDDPVEFLEFRPTLVPAILVNRLWADEGTSVLWKRYPHLPALQQMDAGRRQHYADKVEHIFALGPPPTSAELPDYLQGIRWPNLTSLELEIDFIRHGAIFSGMLHAGLEYLELSGRQSGGTSYFSEVTLPSLFVRSRGAMLWLHAYTILTTDPETFPEPPEHTVRTEHLSQRRRATSRQRLL